MYSQYVFVGVPLHTARIACWFSKATTHWSNFCTCDGIDSQTVLQTICESKIDWTRANFSTKQCQTGAKLNTQNRLDRPTTDQLAQNNPRPRQNKILRIDRTGQILAPNNPKLMKNHVPKIFSKNKLDKGSAK